MRLITTTGVYGIGSIEPVSGYDEESVEEIVDILENQLAPLIIGEVPPSGMILGYPLRELPAEYGIPRIGGGRGEDRVMETLLDLEVRRQAR